MNLDELANPAIKMVFIGDSGVGKTSLIYRYEKDEIFDNPTPTIGAAYLSKLYKYNDVDIELRIWDTAGQETYQSLAPIYFLHSMVGFVVFDISHRSSYNNVKQWIDQLREFAGPNVVTVIVANKSDLESSRQVGKEEYEGLARDVNAICIETSAVTGVGISEMINESISLLIQTNNDMRYELNNWKKQNEKQQNSVRCC